MAASVRPFQHIEKYAPRHPRSISPQLQLFPLGGGGGGGDAVQPGGEAVAGAGELQLHDGGGAVEVAVGELLADDGAGALGEDCADDAVSCWFAQVQSRGDQR